MIDLKQNRGFTLLECILTLCLFSVVLTTIINTYLSGYIMYRGQEYSVELEANILAVLNRISETLRRTDNLQQNVSVSNKVLYIGNTRYYSQSGTVYEQIGFGINQLGNNISLFEPKLEDEYLIVKIEGNNSQESIPISMEQVFYLGGK